MKILIISLNNPKYNSARTIQFAKVVNAIKSAGTTTTVMVGARTEQFIGKYNSDQTFYLSNSDKISTKKIMQTISKFKTYFFKLFPFSNKYMNDCLAKALSIIDKDQPDCILTSSNPIESHLIGLRIKQKKDLPWIASFSDPRPNSILPPPYKKKRNMQSYFEKCWVKSILLHCDAVHMPSKYGIDLIEKVFSVSLNKKSFIIPHVGLIPKTKLDTKYDKCLVHTGRLIRSRISNQFLAAIRETYRLIPQYFNGLICVGIVSAEFKRKIKEMNIEKIVQIIDQVSYEESNNIIANAGAAVLLEANMSISPFLPSKFVDYVSNRKPILAVTPPISAIRDYLKKFGGGIAVQHNVKEITAGLVEIFSNNESEKSTNEKLLYMFDNEFSTLNISEMYYNMIKKVIL
jgi:glycosyltransferase involved in cell wall biosynthesis